MNKDQIIEAIKAMTVLRIKWISKSMWRRIRSISSSSSSSCRCSRCRCRSSWRTDRIHE